MTLIIALGLTGIALGAAAMAADTPATRPAAPAAPAALSFTMKDIAGRDVDLSRYGGKVVLIVNVASKCGFTKQYAQLQALHEKYAERGLAILGFPANDFGRQEPGTNAEIATFCTENYGVDFDMFSKVVVKGEGACDLYKHLVANAPDGEGAIKWNFEKFLISRDGRIVARYRSKIAPDAKELIDAIEAELARPAPSDG